MFPHLGVSRIFLSHLILSSDDSHGPSTTLNYLASYRRLSSKLFFFSYLGNDDAAPASLARHLSLRPSRRRLKHKTTAKQCFLSCSFFFGNEKTTPLLAPSQTKCFGNTGFVEKKKCLIRFSLVVRGGSRHIFLIYIKKNFSFSHSPLIGFFQIGAFLAQDCESRKAQILILYFSSSSSSRLFDMA